MARNQKRGAEQQQNANQTTVDERDQAQNQEDEGQDRPFYQDITRGDTRSNPYSVDSDEEEDQESEGQENKQALSSGNEQSSSMNRNRGRDLDEQDED